MSADFIKTEIALPTRSVESAGMGLREDGLPDISWCDIPAGDFPCGEAKIAINVPAFRIGKYPVTYEQFQAFIDDPGGYTDARWWDNLSVGARRQQRNGPAAQRFPFARHPRENVSWYEAMAFCTWLSHKFGQNAYAIIIPNELQWEKAARGTGGLIYPYGDTFDSAKCNVCPTGPDRTTPVDAYPDGASPYGVIDMSGNVWEWTLSSGHIAYDRRDDHSDESCARGRRRAASWRYIMRGGSWRNRPNLARGSARLAYGVANRYINLGFRLVSLMPAQ